MRGDGFGIFYKQQFWPDFLKFIRLFTLFTGYFWPKAHFSFIFHLILTLFFFFFGTFGPDRMGLTAPSDIRHSERAAYLFSYRTVTLRLPGSLTTPKGGGR